MFTAIIRPVKLEFLIVAATALVSLSFARFVTGDGGTWNTLAILVTIVIFAHVGRQLPALRGLDVDLGTWYRGIVSVGMLWSAVMALTATVSMGLASELRPWYGRIDDYLFPSLWLTGLFLFVSFFGAAVTGVAVGLGSRRYGTVRIAALGLSILVGYLILVFLIDGVYVPTQLVQVPATGERVEIPVNQGTGIPFPGVATIIVGLMSVPVTRHLARRIEP